MRSIQKLLSSARQGNVADTTYNVNNHKPVATWYSLVDRCANCGVLGVDVQIIEQSNRFVTSTGFDNHQLTDHPLCTGAAFGYSNKGPVITIMKQYDSTINGKTIHSSLQMVLV
jgi:hypothetical protein